MHAAVPPSGSRAVSAMFRVFGRGGAGPSGEAVLATPVLPMDGDERRALSLLVPSTVLAVAWSVFGARWFGIAAPGAALVMLHVLPLALGGRGPAAQWRIWCAALGLWSVFHAAVGGWVAWVAWIWIAILSLEAAAMAVLAWRAAMNARGGTGIIIRCLLLLLVHGAALGLGISAGWPWAVAAGGLIAAWCCKAVLDPACRWLGPVVTHVGDGPLLTIDDGPDPSDTPRILDLLDQHGRKAVFFLIGEKAAAHPELVREIVRRGHEIGNHTMTHPQASFWCAGPLRTRREIARCQEVLTDITGTPPRWFRAPVGHRNLFTHPVAGDLGLTLMGWSRRGYDAVGTDVETMLARLTSPPAGMSDIVLLHESTPVATAVLTGVLASLPARR